MPILLAAATETCLAQPTPNGPDSQVNTGTTGYQRIAAVGADPRGDFVVVWDSDVSTGNDNLGSSIQARRFGPGVEPLGAELQVNSYTTGRQTLSDIGMTSDGGFVVSWTSDGSPGGDDAGYSIQARRFEPDGTPLDDQFQVNDQATGSQILPAIAVDGSDRFVIAWASSASSGSDSDLGSVQARRFDADGTPLGAQVQVNTYTTGQQEFPDVAIDSLGRFVVVWSSDGSAGTDSDQRSIQARRYDATGAPVGDQFQVNVLTTGRQTRPGVAVAEDGSFVVVWTHEGSAPTDFGYSIRGRRFDPGGMPLGQEFQVNSYTTGVQFESSVSFAAGELVVTWTGSQSPGGDHSDSSVQARRLAWDGTARTDDFQVNTYQLNQQRAPAIAVDASGNFVVAWQSTGSAGDDTSATSVQVRRWDDPFVDGFESGDTSRWSATSP